MADTIQLPSIRGLWKVRAVDEIGNPKTFTNLLMRKSPTIRQALQDAEEAPGFKSFKAQFPKAEIVAVEFVGFTEN